MAGINLVGNDKHRYFPTDENYIYLYHTGRTIWLPTYPDNMSDSTSVSFNTTSILGRSAPIYSYQNSGPRTVNFLFNLHRDMFEYDTALETRDKNAVDTIIKEIQSAALPNYVASDKLVDPPLVAVSIGTDLYIKGVISSNVSVSYSGPILRTGKYAVISIEFGVSEVDPYDAEIVRLIGSWRVSDDIKMRTSLDATTYSGLPKNKSRLFSGELKKDLIKA